MKEPNRAPAYAVIYHGLATVARKHGYALAIHGSVLNDLDLIAVPWVDDCADPYTLFTEIKKFCGAVGVNLDQEGKEHYGPERKPHGRLAWKLHMGHGAAVDFSVLPRTNKPLRD